MERRLGPYVVEQLLGQGATASVHKAQHSQTGHIVALKIFHPGLWNSEDYRKRAFTEFKTVSTLNHPNIVGVVDSLFDQDPPAVAMEYIDGSSLETFQARLPYILPEVSVAILIEVLKALEQAHAQGIVHRDLKPANILISNDGRVLVSDFGHSKLADASRITLTGTILGSPDFMSPEQALGETADFRSDIFSAGSVLYFLLTGTKPFAKPSPLATLAAVIQAHPELAIRRNPKISPQIQSLLDRALAKNPEDRYPSIQVFREELERYLQSLGLGAESFSFALWLRDPHGTGLHALRTIADKLSQQADASLAQNNWQQALSVLSHLSLVAPESSQLARHLTRIEATRNVIHRQQRRKKAAAWLSASLLILMGLYFGIQNFVRDSDSTPKSNPVVVATPPTPSPEATIATQPAPMANKSRNTSAALDKSYNPQKITFDLPSDVKVLWNGRVINAARGMTVPRPGIYKVRLEKTGSPPIEQSILVKANEPTHIRAR